MLVERLRGLRLGVPNLLDASGGCSPILQPEVLPALALTLCLGAAFELNEVGKRTRAGLRFNEWAVDSVAGCYDWDPRAQTDAPTNRLLSACARAPAARSACRRHRQAVAARRARKCVPSPRAYVPCARQWALRSLWV
jgi:hypothetical protein